MGHFKAKFFPKIVTRKKSQKQLASDCWVEISACKIPICLQGCSSVKLSYLQSSQWRNTFHVIHENLTPLDAIFPAAAVLQNVNFTQFCVWEESPQNIRTWNFQFVRGIFLKICHFYVTNILALANLRLFNIWGRLLWIQKIYTCDFIFK